MGWAILSLIILCIWSKMEKVNGEKAYKQHKQKLKDEGLWYHD